MIRGIFRSASKIEYSEDSYDVKNKWMKFTM